MSVERWLLRPMVVAVGSCFAAVPAWANPTGPQVMNGNVQIQGLGTNHVKVTNTPNSIIHWQGFSIGAGQITQFQQQSAASAVLNRVVGPDISSIQGQLTSNGRVFLINPAGIIVGPGGVIDTAGFVGSTLNMLNADFLAGKLRFHGDASSGSIVNQGLIRVGQGGNVILAAPHIYNSGVVRADGGEIVLAAGQKMTIGSLKLEGIQFEIQAPSDSAINVGKLLAEDGAVGVFAGTLRHSGDIRATALVRDEGGRVVLKAQKDAFVEGNATIAADSATGKGGSVQVLGERVGLFDSAAISASGPTGGGEILIGGDYKGANPLVQNAWRTFVGPEVTLRADALTSGDGGKVIIWADDITRAYGTISARGGAQAGNGGFVEVSGKQWLDFAATVDASAANGKTGTLLLDPKFIIVSDTDAGAVTYTDNTNNRFANNPGATTVFRATGANSIGSQTANVFLEANTDITFTSPFTIAAGGVALNARAGRSILVNASIGTTNANITLSANDSGATSNRDAGAGQLTMAPGTLISAGSGTVRLEMGTNAGGSGDITLANISSGNISVYHDGPSMGGRIMRPASGATPMFSVPPGGAVHLEIETAAGGTSAGGTTSGIGTSASPIQITATGGGTVILESHYHGGGAGIFIDALSPLQIGGATAVFPIGMNVKGVQALNENGTGAAGPVRVTSTGPISQQTGGGALCGAASGGQSGGPVCAGSFLAGVFTANDGVTLRGSDMALASPVRGTSVVLLPLNNGTIGLGAGAAGTLQLDQLEFNRITTPLLQIGETGSNTITFGAGGIITTAGSVTAVELRTSGNIVSGGGTLDLSTASNNGPITFVGNAVGAAGNAGRIKVDPGNTATGTVTSTGGGVFVQRVGGDMVSSRFSFSGSNNVEFATSDGDLVNDLGFGSTGTADIRLFAGVATATPRNIVFSGGTRTSMGSGFTLTPNAGGSTMFTGGTQTFSLPVTTTRPIIVAGGTVTFDNTLMSTGTGGAGTLQITSGTATFNSAASFTSTLEVSGTGVLAGTGAVTGPSGLDFLGGTISNTGGVMITNNTVVNNTAQLTGTLNTDTFSIPPGATLNIATGGLLIQRGTTTSVLNGTLSISGTHRVTGGVIQMSDASARLTINTGGVLDFQAANANLIGDVTARPLVTNNGTLRKSVNTGTTLIGSSNANFDLDFVNNGTLDAQVGTIDYASPGNMFNNGTMFIGGGTNRVAVNSTFTGTITSNGLSLEGGSFGGSATFAGTTTWIGGTMTGSHSIPATPTSTLIISGPSSKAIQGNTTTFTNAGTTSLTGGNLFLVNGATFRNTGTFSMAGPASVMSSGTPSSFNNVAGRVNKTGAGTTSQFGAGLTVTNTSTPSNLGVIDVQDGTLQMNASFPNNDGQINTALTSSVFSTNGASLDNRSGGLISGVGRMNLGTGTLTNNGRVAPGNSAGTLFITGNYVQTSSGRLEIELGSTSDCLTIFGTASLDGLLAVTHLTGFTPSAGQAFIIMNYTGGRTPPTSDFASATFPSGFSYTRNPNPTFYELVSSGSSFSSSSSSSPSSMNAGELVLREQERQMNDLPREMEQSDPRPRREARMCTPA